MNQAGIADSCAVQKKSGNRVDSLQLCQAFIADLVPAEKQNFELSETCEMGEPGIPGFSQVQRLQVLQLAQSFNTRIGDRIPAQSQVFEIAQCCQLGKPCITDSCLAHRQQGQSASLR